MEVTVLRPEKEDEAVSTPARSESPLAWSDASMAASAAPNARIAGPEPTLVGLELPPALEPLEQLVQLALP